MLGYPILTKGRSKACREQRRHGSRGWASALRSSGCLTTSMHGCASERRPSSDRSRWSSCEHSPQSAPGPNNRRRKTMDETTRQVIEQANATAKANRDALQALLDRVVNPKLAASTPKQRKPLVFRERDLRRAIAGHLKAGLSVHHTLIDKDGRISIFTGQPEPTSVAPANEWDTVK